MRRWRPGGLSLAAWAVTFWRGSPSRRTAVHACSAGRWEGTPSVRGSRGGGMLTQAAAFHPRWVMLLIRWQANDELALNAGPPLVADGPSP